MPLQQTIKTWDDYTQTEEYKGLSPTDREILSRKYLSQKVATDPEYRKLPQEVRKGLIAKVRGIDRGAPSGPSAMETAGREFKGAFSQNLTGALMGFKPEATDNPGILDAYGDLFQNLKSGNTAGMGQGLAGFAGSVAGQVADPAGIAIDLATAGIGGKLLSKTPRAASIAAGAASGAIQGGGVAALQGGNAAQGALSGAALGGAVGMLAPGGRKAPPAAAPPVTPPASQPRLPAATQLLALPPARSGPVLPSDGSVIPMPPVRKPTPPVTPPGLLTPAPKPLTREQVARQGYTPDEMMQMRQAAPDPSGTFAERADRGQAALNLDLSRPGADLELLRMIKQRPAVRQSIRGTEEERAARDLFDPKSDAPAPDQAGGSFFRRLAADEGGTATVEGAAGLPAIAAGGAVRAVGKANEVIDNTLGKAFALPGQALAAGVNRAAGRDVLRSGWDDVAGQDRLGAQVGEAYDWLRREAGNDHPFFGRMLRGARNYLQGDTSLPAGYQATRDRRQMQGRLIQQEGRQMREQLEAGLTPEQQQELYRVLNDRELTDTALAGVSEPVRQRIDSLSKELVDVGSITPKAYEVHQNQYLRRLYEKYYSEEPAVARWLKSFSQDVKGSFARGKERKLSDKTAALFSRKWEDTGKTNGNKAILRDADTGELREVTAGNVGNYLGTWRKTGEGKYRRDWTEAERTKMGEIRRAPVAIEETFKAAGRDLANGRLLKDVATNPEWSMPASAVRSGLADAPEGWVLIDDYSAGALGRVSKKASTNRSGLPKWGALAGHYVEPNIARDLAMGMQARDRGNLSQLMSWWKKGKTVYNLKSHVNNFVQNLVALELNGASAFDLPEAAALLRQRGGVFDQMEAAGVFDNSFAATEFAAGMEGVGIGNPWNFVQQGAKVMQGLDSKLTNAYQGADDLFRAAYVLRRMRDGMPLEEAAKLARERFYNGTINSPFIQDASSTALPFIKPAAWSAAEVPKMIMRNPAKVAKIAALYYGWNELSKAMTGDTDERVSGRQAMYPPHQQGPGKIAQMPMRDTLGQPLIADIQNYAPWNSFQVAENSPFGIVPQSVIPSGPMVNVVEGLANVDLFRRKPITDKAKTYGDQAADYADFAARALLPSTLATDIGIPGVTRGKLMGALMGQEDAGGRQYDMPTAAANLAFKVQPFNEPLAYQKMVDRYGRELQDIKSQISQAGKALQTGIITPEQYQARVAQYGALLQAKAQEMREKLQQAQPALRAGAAEAAGR